MSIKALYFRNKYAVNYSLVAAIVISFIYSGFGYKVVRTVACTSESVSYMQAQYSQTETGVDYEGYKWSETSRWEEEASKEYFVLMTGFNVDESNGKYSTNIHRISKPVIKYPYNERLRNTQFFTGFSQVNKTTNTQSFNDGRTLNIEDADYALCNNMVNKFSRVKVWYGMIYRIVK